MQTKKSILKLLCFPVFVFSFLAITGFKYPHSAHRLIGIWESDEKDLQIEMFEDNGRFAGKMIYFKCASDDIMRSCTDSENPDESLTTRKLLGLKLVTLLSYEGESIWGNGKIYDPNSGHTFDARIQLTGENTAIVRGYWKYRWIGRSMVFNRKL
jgi:uncharacterized protein (DUF2147 family)